MKASDNDVLLWIKVSKLDFFMSTFWLYKYGVRIKSISLFCSSVNFMNIQGHSWIAFSNSVKKKTTKKIDIRPILKDLCFLIRSDFR